MMDCMKKNSQLQVSALFKTKVLVHDPKFLVMYAVQYIKVRKFSFDKWPVTVLKNTYALCTWVGSNMLAA